MLINSASNFFFICLGFFGRGVVSLNKISLLAVGI